MERRFNQSQTAYSLRRVPWSLALTASALAAGGARHKLIFNLINQLHGAITHAANN